VTTSTGKLVPSLQPAAEPGSAADRLLRLAVASAKVGIWEWDVRSGRVECSEWVGPLYGLSTAELAQHYEGFMALVHPSDRQRVADAVEASLHSSSDEYAIEHRVVWPDGSLHWLEVRGHVYRDAAGGPLRMAGTVGDITSRKQAEEKLIASEALLRQLIAYTPAAVAMFDSEMRYLQVSERWLTDYQLSAQEIVGRSHYEVFPDIPERWKEVHRCVLAGAIERSDEDPFPRADGTLEWLQWEVRPWRNPEGLIGGLIMFTQVVTERKRTELQAARLARDLEERVKQLRSSEDRFRSALHHSPIGMAIVAPDGAWIEVNPALCKIVGYTHDELLGSNFQAITHPDDLGRDLDNLKQMLARGIDEYQMEKRYIHKNGSTIWVQLNVSLVWNLDATPRHFISQIQDISERKRVERELRKAEEKFSSMFLAAPIGISITRVQDGRLVDINREFERLLGYTREEALGRTTLELGLWTDAEWRRSFLKRLDGSGGVEGFEAPIRVKNGSLLPVSISAQSMTLDGESYLVSALVDLTERKRTEAAIRASEARLRRVVGSPILGIAFGLADGVVTEANDEYMRIVGHTREELAAGLVSFRSLTPPEFQSVSAKALREVTETGTSRPWEMEIARKDGKRVPVLLGVSAIDDDRSHDVAFVFDLTERRALERQLQHAQRMEAVGRLAAGIAHDFNNVLAAITMSCELLRDGLSLGHPGMDDVLEIRKAADRAVRLIRQLLAFSRQQVLEPRVLDLNELVANLEKMLRRLVGEDVEIVCKFAATVGAVKADPGQLEQVVINLAVNARDAMARGGTLTITTANVFSQAGNVPEQLALTPGPHVMLSVMDTGSGMDAQTRARMFEPFFTTKEQGKGTGLGLSTVYGIVRQSGGTIDVASELGRGTTFRIFLPRVDEAVEAAAGEGVPESIGGTETVLVVEDDAAVRQVTRKTLVRLGYRVLDAPNPRAASELVKVYVGAIDVLLTDLVMPGGSGRTLAAALLPQRPKLRVLYMSGYTEDADMRLGMDPKSTYIQKPFSSNALAHKLRALLDS
jgi:PAS domain S-box-containing protein